MYKLPWGQALSSQFDVFMCCAMGRACCKCAEALCAHSLHGLQIFYLALKGSGRFVSASSCMFMTRRPFRCAATKSATNKLMPVAAEALSSPYHVDNQTCQQRPRCSAQPLVLHPCTVYPFSLFTMHASCMHAYNILSAIKKALQIPCPVRKLRPAQAHLPHR
jgi:hypothetical protein